MFVTQPTTSEGHSARPEEAPMQPSALPPVRSTPPVSPRRSSLFRLTVQPVQPDVATMLLEQMRQMQAQNQREFARLEQQGAPDQAPDKPATVVTGGQRANTPDCNRRAKPLDPWQRKSKAPRVDCSCRPLVLSPCGPRHSDELVHIKGDPHR